MMWYTLDTKRTSLWILTSANTRHELHIKQDWNRQKTDVANLALCGFLGYILSQAHILRVQTFCESQVGGHKTNFNAL